MWFVANTCGDLGSRKQSLSIFNLLHLNSSGNLYWACFIKQFDGAKGPVEGLELVLDFDMVNGR